MSIWQTYFIQQGDDGPIKIGVATDVGRRLRAHQCGNPDPLRILVVVPGHHEREIHARLAASLIHGEWYRSTPEVLAEVASAATRDWMLCTAMPVARRACGCMGTGRHRKTCPLAANYKRT